MYLKPFQKPDKANITIFISEYDREPENWLAYLMGFDIATGEKQELSHPIAVPVLMFETVRVPWQMELTSIVSDGQLWGEIADDCASVGMFYKDYSHMRLKEVDPEHNLSLADGEIFSGIAGKVVPFLTDVELPDRLWFKSLPDHIGASLDGWEPLY
jgi:hypothetical protein